MDNLWQTSNDEYNICPQAVDSMPSGCYSVKFSNQKGIFFQAKKIKMDEVEELDNTDSKEIIEHIKLFWRSESEYRTFNYLWKLGVLLHGIPGGGKSTTINLISREITKQDGLTIYCGVPENLLTALQHLRKVEPKRKIIVILEDIDRIIDYYGDRDLLALLDGEHQIDNVVFIATTNYPEKLGDTIMKRRSRFDIIKEIGKISAKVRRGFIKKRVEMKRKISDEELEEFVDKTEDFTLVDIKDVILSVEVFGKTLDEGIAKIKDGDQKQHSSHNYKKKKHKVGFGFMPSKNKPMDDDWIPEEASDSDEAGDWNEASDLDEAVDPAPNDAPPILTSPED